MNLAEQQHLNTNAANCIASETPIGLDNPSSCLKSKKVRPVVGLPESIRRSFNADDLPACNWNGMAATIIDDIRFNTRTHKRPKAASIAYWQAYFKGASEQKVRTAIRDAVGSKVLKVTYAMFNGSNTPHYLYVPLGVKTVTHVEINTPPVEINTTITDCINSSNKSLNTDSPGQPAADQVKQECPVNPPGGQGQAEATPTPKAFPDAVEESPKFIGWECKWITQWEAEAGPVSAFHRPRLIQCGTAFESQHRAFTPFLAWLLDPGKTGAFLNWKSAFTNTVGGSLSAKVDLLNPATKTPHADYLLRNAEGIYQHYEQAALGKTKQASGWTAPPKPVIAPAFVPKPEYKPSSVTLAAMKVGEEKKAKMAAALAA